MNPYTVALFVLGSIPLAGGCADPGTGDGAGVAVVQSSETNSSSVIVNSSSGGGSGVSIDSSVLSGSSVSVDTTGVASGSVSIVNGKVTIDGETVPPGVTRFRSKSGTVWRIDRKGSSVSVSVEGEAK